MYAKLENNILKRAPDKVRYNGNIIFNPPNSVLAELGYLPITYTDMPTNIVEGKHYESHWEQGETEITQVWSLVDDPIYPEQEPTMQNLVEAVERGLTT